MYINNIQAPIKSIKSITIRLQYDYYHQVCAIFTPSLQHYIIKPHRLALQYVYMSYIGLSLANTCNVIM